MVVPGRKGMYVRRMNPKKMAMMLSLLSKDGSTIDGLVEKLDLSRSVVWDYVNEMRNARPRIVRIDAWQEARRAGYFVPVYAFGSGPDEKRPPKKTNTERSRDYRNRKKAKELQSILGGINV